MNCSPRPSGTWQIYRGDLLPVFQADARTQDGPMDFTGWSLTFVMSGPVTRGGPATGDALGVLTYVWVAGDTDYLGEYEARFVGVSPEGKQETFPADVLIRVKQP